MSQDSHGVVRQILVPQISRQGRAMGPSFVLQVFDRPAASVNVALLVAVFAKVHSANLDYAAVGANYDAVVCKGQIWRLLTSQFTHISLLHLLMNVASLWNISNFAEGAADSGTVFYISRSLLLLTLSAVGFIFLYAVSVKVLKRQQDAYVTCVGYSSVIFGWMAFLAVTSGSSMSVLVFGMTIPSHVYPWAALVLTSIIIPQASFVGHLAGILAGYSVGYLSDRVNFVFCLIVFAIFLAICIGSWFHQHFDLFREITQSCLQSFTCSRVEDGEDTELIRRERLRVLDPQSTVTV